MTIKHMAVMTVAAFVLAGAAFAEGPKESPEARMQMEIRKAWQQGFEQGYQRAMTYCDKQQEQHRQQMMKARAQMMQRAGEHNGPKASAPCPGACSCPMADRGADACPMADRGERKGPMADRGEGRRGRKGSRKNRPPRD